jgi:hypothetical protein
LGFGLVAVLLASVSGGVLAEVSADTENAVALLYLGITEGPDPIPQVIWQPVRDVDPMLFLNPDGGPRGDGRPAAAFHPVTGWPHVVWAYRAGADREVAYSRWQGGGWGEMQFLTSSTADEVDPRISISADGAIYVVWWDAQTESIWMSSLGHGLSNWTDPEPVTGLVDAGRRPSILEWNGEVLTAYERDAIWSGQDVIVARRVSEGVYATEVVATSPGEQPLDVILHAEGDLLWVDWRHDDGVYAYSVHQGGDWSEVTIVPWTDDSWSRLEEVRRLIRGEILGGQSPGP